MSQNREVNICSDCGYVTVLIARNHFSSHMCRYTHTQHRKNIKMTPDAQFTWSSTGVIVACKRFERNEKQTQTRTADSCLHNTIDQGITASMWWSACDVRCWCWWMGIGMRIMSTACQSFPANRSLDCRKFIRAQATWRFCATWSNLRGRLSKKISGRSGFFRVVVSKIGSNQDVYNLSFTPTKFWIVIKIAS